MRGSHVRRRDFCGAVLAGAASARDNGRPNILWLIGEDLCPDLGCYGNSIVHTPNIDRLAREGTRFDNVFCTGPICSPSRSGIATGVYQTSIDAHHQRIHRDDGYQPPPPIRVFTHLLREAGYHTSNVLKPAPGVRGTGKTDFNFHAENIFDGDDWSQRKSGQPFYAQVNFSDAHRTFRRFAPAIDPAKVQLPPYLPDYPAVREDWTMYLESIQALDDNIGKVLERLEREGLAQNTIVVFFGDNGCEMPRGKTTVYDRGIHVPLIVRFPGKHLPRSVQPGSVRRDLASLFDITATTLEWAGVRTPGWMDARPLFGPRAKPREHVISARDRCDWSVDRVRSVRTERYKYVRNFMPERPYWQHDPYMDVANIPLIVARQLDQEGKLTAAQKLVTAQRRPEEELYDLKADPHEIRNVAADPANAAELRRLRSILTDWIRTSGDKGEIPEKGLPKQYDHWALVDGWASAGECTLRKVPGALRLEGSGKRDLIRCGLVAPGGRFRLELRIKGAKPAGLSIAWGAVTDPANPKNRVPLQAGDFAEFDVPGHLAWVGFELTGTNQVLKLSSIRLTRAGETLREWRFR